MTSRGRMRKRKIKVMKALIFSQREKLKSAIASGRKRFASIFSRVRSWKEYAKLTGQRWYALLWQRIYATHYRFSLWKAQYSSITIAAILLLLIAISFYIAAPLQRKLEIYFSTDSLLSDFRAFVVTVGGALIGAATVAFSLVMFAMQVNVERMPHGLFRKFSSDYKLLNAFAIIFASAIAIAAMSLIPNISWLSVAALITWWGVMLILALFIYAYKRALSLINPSQQLNLILESAQADLQVWARRAHRAAPLFPNPPDDSTASPIQPSHDLKRVAYFKLNRHWTAAAQKAILYAISFSRRYAEQGDHEVSRIALNTVVEINVAYLDAKGKTFFSSNGLIENPLESDGFINETLEYLRQNVQIGISRRDEQQIEHSLRAMTDLCQVYIDIDYGKDSSSKTHANLAIAYLSAAAQSLIPHGMSDVLMEAVRLLGEAGQLVLRKGNVSDVATVSEKIALLSCSGVIREDYRPITRTGVEQLAKLTFMLIRHGSTDIGFAARKIRTDMSLVAKTFLKITDGLHSSIHSAYLAPYYSSTTTSTLQQWLSELANSVARVDARDETAKTIIGNIESWADQIYDTEKKLLLLAIEQRSGFTFDIIHWIAHITKFLLAVSNSSACSNHYRNELRRSAFWLISVLSWVPDNKEAIIFVENYAMTETLYDSADDAFNRECDEVGIQVRKLLLSWAFKAGKYETGLAILERSLYALATLDLRRAICGEALLAEIGHQLAAEGAPAQSVRDRTARTMRERATSSFHRLYPLSRVEYQMGRVDQEKLRELLFAIAHRLSPETTGESVRSRFL